MAFGYRETLLGEFQQRTRQNPAYSLRAFSRDIGVPASNLSNILRSKRGLSLATAKRIAERMGMQGDEKTHFLALVQKEHGRSSGARHQAARTLKDLKQSVGFGELSLERFELLANWIYFAILELTHVRSFRPEAAWIAHRLKVERQEIEVALSRLIKLGLLEKIEGGGLRETVGDIATPAINVPSRFIQEHHRQILGKALGTLGTIPVAQREFAALTMAIDARKLPAAQEALRAFRRQFAKDMQKSKSKDRLYCLALQFFPLDTNEMETE
jgi:uncharacterized protein (TIGR02147 family)